VSKFVQLTMNGTMVDMHRVLRKLEEKRPIFHSEADFQYAFSRVLNEMDDKAEVRLEYPIRFISDKKNRKIDNRALDIWIKNKKIAIELKYALKKIDFSHKGEAYSLKSSRIHNLRYSFVKDVSRTEDLVWANKIKKGYAIVISNNRSMWSKGEGGSEMFSLDTILKGKMKWTIETSKKIPIKLRGEYSMDWKKYSQLDDHRFRYMALEITKEV